MDWYDRLSKTLNEGGYEMPFGATSCIEDIIRLAIKEERERCGLIIANALLWNPHLATQLWNKINEEKA